MQKKFYDIASNSEIKGFVTPKCKNIPFRNFPFIFFITLPQIVMTKWCKFYIKLQIPHIYGFITFILQVKVVANFVALMYDRPKILAVLKMTNHCFLSFVSLMTLAMSCVIYQEILMHSSGKCLEFLRWSQRSFHIICSEIQKFLGELGTGSE